MKYKAGNVSFPQPLAPCGTGMLALSLTVSGRKELRHQQEREGSNLEESHNPAQA